MVEPRTTPYRLEAESRRTGCATLIDRGPITRLNLPHGRRLRILAPQKRQRERGVSDLPEGQRIEDLSNAAE